MDAAEARPMPEFSEWTKPFWDAAGEGRLLIQTCEDCAARIMYPKRYCPTCMSDQLGWIESAGKGLVYSFTVQERGAPSGFKDRVPYVVAVIRLDEGVQLMSNVVGPGAEGVACEDRVEVEFEAVDGAVAALPVFHLAEDPSGS